MTETTHPERTVGDVVTALLEKQDNRDGIRDVQQDDAGGDHRVESSGRSQVEETEDTDDDTGHGVSVPGDSETGVNLGPQGRTGKTTVTGKGPAQTCLPGVACNLASETGEADQELHKSSAGNGTGSLVVQLKNGSPGGGVDEALQVVDGEEHGNGVKERSKETNGDGTDDSERNVALG